MKNIYLTLFVVLFTLSGLQNNACGQAPEGIIYQAEAHDEKGLPIRNASLDVKIIILQDNINGSIVWEGLHNVTTNNYGIFQLVIGAGTSSYFFEDIEWESHLHFLNVQVKSTNGKKSWNWIDMGTSQLLSVPYALHAKTAGSAINDEVDDADADPENELITGVNLNGQNLEITDAGGTSSVDLSGFKSYWSQENSNIHYTEGNVGMGVENPLGKLHVRFGESGASRFIGDGLLYESNNNGWFAVYTPSNGWGGLMVSDPEDFDEARLYYDHGTNSWHIDGNGTQELMSISSLGKVKASAFVGDGSGLSNISDNDWNVLGDNIIRQDGNVGIGTSNPTVKLDISGQIKIQDGTHGTGKVLTSDANGLAHWEALPTYSIGDLAQGGYVFYVTPNGKHGLAAARQDQGFIAWYGAENLCNDPAFHDAVGQEFTDWRLPTKRELYLMYLLQNEIGNFELNYYWSSTESNGGAAWELSFINGGYYSGFKYWTAFIRAVRAF